MDKSSATCQNSNNNDKSRKRSWPSSSCQMRDTDQDEERTTKFMTSNNFIHNSTAKSGDSTVKRSANSESSVTLDHLINQYDGESDPSLSQSALTLFYSVASRNQNNQQQSKKQNFMKQAVSRETHQADTKLFGSDSTIAHDDDTTSFYSALTSASSFRDSDGPLPVNTQVTKKTPKQQSSDNLFLWQTCDRKKPNNHKKNDIMIGKSDFQLFWSDISYQIKPKLNLEYARMKFRRIFNYESLQRIFQFLNNDINTSQKVNHNNANFNSPQKQAHRYKQNNPDCITILNRMDGSFKSGELTAVMGPSGAGKTSLLNFISRRCVKGYTGWLILTGRKRKVKISIIPQHDSLPGNLTVRENLMYASRLKNAHLHIDHSKSIETIANLLGIENCLETKTKKISGGEQKRLSIAQELLSRPDILILDEPTSGLDSLTCYKTLCILRDLVRASSSRLIDPIAILLSIHQPQQEIFELFDKIYMISSGGTPIYDGPPTCCLQYIEQQVKLQMPSTDYNPASFLIEIASGQYGREPILKLESKLKEKFREKVKSLNFEDDIENRFSHNWRCKNQETALNHGSIDAYNDNSDQNMLNYQHQFHNQTNTFNIDPRIPEASSTNHGQFFLKTRILLERCWLSTLRDPKQSILRTIYFLLVPLALSFMNRIKSGPVDGCPRYIQSFKLNDVLRNNSELLDKQVQEEMLTSLENLGLYFMTIFSLIAAIIGTMAVTFSTDIRRSVKEFYNGWYPMSCYLIARIISEAPLQMILPTMSMILIYILTGQYAKHGLSTYYRFMLVDSGVVMSSLISQILGMIIGAIFIGDITTALFVSQGILLPLVFVSGFIVRTKNMSSFIYVLSQTSFIKHALDIAVIGRYGFGVCPCNESEITGTYPELLEVPENLRYYTQMWLSTSNQESDLNMPVIADNHTKLEINQTSSNIGVEPEAELDLFQLFARQVYLYNTRGIHINSCSDMVPYQMKEVDLTDSDMYIAFAALCLYLLIVISVLFVVVRLMMRFRRSL